MTPAGISQHETRHIFGAAAAITLLDPEQYGSATVLFQMDGKSGEMAMLHHREKLAESVAYLAAVAPITKSGDPKEIFKLLRDPDKNPCLIKKAGDLSDKDVQLFNAHNGPVTQPIIVAFAALELEKDLGIGRFRSLSKRLRDASNQNLVPDSGWPLEDIVPKAKAQSSVKRAKALFSDMTDTPKSAFKGWDRLPPIGNQ